MLRKRPIEDAQWGARASRSDLINRPRAAVCLSKTNSKLAHVALQPYPPRVGLIVRMVVPRMVPELQALLLLDQVVRMVQDLNFRRLSNERVGWFLQSERSSNSPGIH